MRLIANRNEIKAYESKLIEEAHISEILLMERAAITVASYIEKNDFTNVLIAVGSGNNGADGLAVARILSETDCHVDVYFCGDVSKCSDLWKQQDEMLSTSQINKISQIDSKNYDCIIDAILGIGQNRNIEGNYGKTVTWINDYRKNCKNCRVIAIDLPTGIHTDSGKVLSCAVKADSTITFTCKKWGHLLGDGPEYCGEVIIERIGSIQWLQTQCQYLTKDDSHLLPHRSEIGNKGTFGKVLCITGNKDTPGASLLNAGAVLKSGAGMVKIVTPFCNRDLLISEMPEAMYADREEIESQLKQQFSWCDCVVIGCGIGVNRESEQLLKETLISLMKPVIIDADALVILKNHKEWLKSRKEKGLITILTPHPKEFSVLFDVTMDDKIHNDPLKCKELAKEYGCILVAKSARTIITDGNQVWINDSGTQAMATAGSGDVLAGILGALVCVCKTPIEASVLGVYCHGLCGEEANRKLGCRSTTAKDIMNSISTILKEIDQR